MRLSVRQWLRSLLRESHRAVFTMEQYLQFSGMTVDQLKDQVRPEATTRIQSSLVLEQIAKEENIEVTDADIDAEVEKMAKAYGMELISLKSTWEMLRRSL